MVVKLSPFLLFDSVLHKHFLRRFEFFGKILEQAFPPLVIDIKMVDPTINPRIYLANSVLSALFFGLIFLFIGLVLGTGTLAYVMAFFVFLFFLFINITYPKIKLADLNKRSDVELLSVVSIFLIMIRAGLNIIDAMFIAGKEEFYVSRKIREVLKYINLGIDPYTAIEYVMRSIQAPLTSKFFYTIADGLRGGGKLEDKLKTLEEEVRAHNKKILDNYVSTANFFLFLYMMGGLVLPVIGIVFLIILAPFMGIPINEWIFIAMFALAIIGQIFIAGYLRASKPPVI